MIVAHPDDEALFGGAELLTHPDEYKVVVIDEYHNDIRRREFLDSMRCHDILSHLRPEKLWVFDRGDRLSDEMIERKKKLLQVYQSQVGVLDWFNPWHESMRKFK